MKLIDMMMLVIIFAFETVLLGIIYMKSRRNDTKYAELLREKDILQKEKKALTEQKEDAENKIAEKSFKFVAINQMAKTLAKEKNTRQLKKLILDMLLETNTVMRGLTLENSNGTLELFETRNIERREVPILIEKRKSEVLWDYLRNTKVSRISNFKYYPEFNNITSVFKDGYVISFMTADETEKEDLSLIVILGEKSYGEYADGDEEFLDTLAGQIEIVYENSLKTTYIRERNDELTEKVYNLMTLNYAGKMVSSTLDIDEIFVKSIDMFSEVSRASGAMVIYYDKDTEEMEVKGARGDFSEGVKGLKLHVKKEDLAFINKEDNVIVLTGSKESDVSKLFDFYGKSKEIFKIFKHELFIPLVAKDELMGIVLLGMKFNEEGYKDENIEVYSTLAGQIAISLYNAKLYNMAITDGMTKLYLHRYFKTRLAEEMERAKRYDRQMSLIMTDIDHFKKFNDTYGHQTGDEVLKMVAHSVKEAVRKSDIASRYGGEEFAIVLPETGEEGARVVAENLRRKIENKVMNFEGKDLKVAISLGVYTYNPETDQSETIDMIIKKADVSLYYSKKNGRNRTTHYNQIKEYTNEGEDHR